MANLSVDQALSKAKSYARKGEIEEAQKLYQNVLQAFPKNGRAQKGLDALNKANQLNATQSPTQVRPFARLGGKRFQPDYPHQSPNYWKCSLFLLTSLATQSEKKQGRPRFD